MWVEGAASGLQTQALTSPGALQEIKPEWRALWRGCPDATPFQAPEWLLPWWEHFGGGALQTLAFRRNGALLAVAPFFLRQDHTLLLTGTGNSDYLDILCKPQAAREVVAALAGFLNRCPALERCDFQQLRPGSPLLALPTGGHWHERIETQEVCPALELPAAGPRFERLAYYQRRLSRMGTLRLEHATHANLPRMLDALFALHRARWLARGSPGALADPATQRFHRQSAAAFLKAGALRMLALQLDRQTVAVCYGHRHGSRAYYYLGGFDPALEKLSVGTLLVGLAIQAAQNEGASSFDFLRGAEGYKYAWGARDRINARRQLWKTEAK